MDSRMVRLALIQRRVDAAIAALEAADRLLTDAVIGDNDDLAYESWHAGVSARALRDVLTAHVEGLQASPDRSSTPLPLREG